MHALTTSLSRFLFFFFISSDFFLLGVYAIVYPLNGLVNRYFFFYYFLHKL